MTLSYSECEYKTDNTIYDKQMKINDLTIELEGWQWNGGGAGLKD